jgi:hypothetical protein
MDVVTDRDPLQAGSSSLSVPSISCHQSTTRWRAASMMSSASLVAWGP